MNKKGLLNSLKVRMLLNFLLMLGVIVIVTLYTVQSATYKHSTGQLQDHARTSTNVVKDKITNRGNALQEALNTVSKDFSFKQLIVTGESDPMSLLVALQNYQRRNDADIAWVLDAQGSVLTTSNTKDIAAQKLEPRNLSPNTTQIIKIAGEFYLLKAAPVKFVESSRNINAWLIMGIDARKLITPELVELTDMEITLLVLGANHQIIGSTFSSELREQLTAQQIALESGLNQFQGDMTQYIYSVSEFGSWNETPTYLLLATKEEKAYLSYNSLLVQLIGILAIAAVMALLAAMILSNGITSPITKLVAVANKIRQGEYVSQFPSCSTNEVSTLSAAISEMQEGIKSREEEIQKLAYFDSLTELPNRNQFLQHLGKQIEANPDSELAVLMMDLDRFKDINDTVGHDIGDKLLQDIAKRLRDAAYQGVFIAHMGGDEFGIVIDHTNGQNPKTIAENFSALFQRPFLVSQLTLDVDVSMGIACYPKDGKTAHELMQCVDIALYTCKGQHFPYAIYQPSLNKHSVQRLSLMSELRGAVAEGQLKLYYQPKLAIAEGRISTVECLVRWIHPTHGFIPPDEFIPLAEQTGAIRDVTHWVLKEAFKQQQEWAEAGHQIGIAINISAVDLVDMTLPAYVAELMSEHNTDSDALTLEVTESAVMSEPESALKALNTLQRMGIALSIDDFGTGYSSMAQLKKMPVKELKIDKAFVLELASNEDDRIMVRTLISLAQNLGLNTVAEGVEDEESLNLLAEMGCTKAQGFYLSRPLPAPDFRAWLEEYQTKHKAHAEA
ncbi:EAL domain-containing protein [Paraneptunicella aestuarii]|uniref:EAL domain-containing protein n=1 Tax=Paraneptunicella aestuarii TaxID=2831148 RepID=UPI001E363AFF|nr:EAL domain-containing protein [Paraneptunicella aestuarii]